MSEPLVEVEGLHVGFSTPQGVVEDFNLSVCEWRYVR